MKRFTILVPVVVGLLAVLSPVQAELLEGQTVQTIYFRSLTPDSTTVIGPVDRVVGPGIELTNFADVVTVDFSDTNIVITATRNATTTTFLEVLRFSDVKGTIPAITSVTMNPATTYAGFNASRITFDTEIVSLNLTGLPGLQGQRISLHLTGDAAPARCDADGNGTVDFKDALAVLRFLRTGEPLPGNGDCNTDGVVNFRDILAIIRRLG